MTEREMEDLLWTFPDKFLNDPLTQFRRQPVSQVGRADLVFKDRLGRLLVVELKKGKLERGAIDQLFDSFGMLKRRTSAIPPPQIPPLTSPPFARSARLRITTR